MRTAKEIREANEILGEYVGWKYSGPQGDEDHACYRRVKLETGCLNHRSASGMTVETRDHFTFHKNLDELFEIVTKIQSEGYNTSLRYDPETRQHSFSIRPPRLSAISHFRHPESSLLAIFEACLDFVKKVHLNVVES